MAEIAKKFLDIPYKFGGRDFDGVDCIGLLILWFKEQGIEYEYKDKEGAIHMNWYKHHPRRLVESITQHGQLIRFSDLKKNDVLLLTNPQNENIPVCVAVMVDERHILTITDQRNSFVEMLNMQWRERFWGGLHLSKVEEMGL